ncbi:hypothetical protein JCM19992_04050 [Thermostilla marina]
MNRHLSLVSASYATCILSVWLVCVTAVVSAVGGPLSAQTVPAPRPAHRFVFDGVTPQRAIVPDRAGDAPPMEYDGKQPFQVVAGRRPGSHAVRLDAGAFRTQPPKVGERGITIQLSFRMLGHGSELGNGRKNGMFFAFGNGYWEGLRSYCDVAGGNDVLFQIGRPQPQSAYSVSSPVPIVEGAWQVLTVTWDRKQMAIYLDGLPVAAGAFDGAYTPPQGVFRVGFADSGVGSLVLDVDEVAVFDRGLTPAEAFAAAWNRRVLPAETAAGLAQAGERCLAGKWAEGEAAYASLAAQTADTAIAAACRLGRIFCRLRQDDAAGAASIAASLLDMAEVPDDLRLIAASHCLCKERAVIAAGPSLELLSQLAGTDDAPLDDRALRSTLAETALRNGDWERASSLFRQLAEDAEISPSDRWNYRLQAAHALAFGKQFAAAREAYRALADDPDAPQLVRGLACLAIGRTFERAGDPAQAEEAYTAAARRDDILPHHAQEAAELAAEMRRSVKGLPRRDGAAGKTPIPPFPAPGLVLHVAPSGDDAAPGTVDAPLASLAGARDRIRAIRREKGLPSGGITVLIHGGTYSMRATTEFTAEDAGTAESPIVYRAAPGETPIFSGGVQLVDFSRVDDPALLARLPESARGHVYQCDLRKHGVTDFGAITVRGYGHAGYPVSPWVDLYVNRRAMQIARWPNDDFVTIGKVEQGAFQSVDARKPGIFHYDGDRPNRWRPADDVWMFGYWGHLWAGSTVRIAALDTENRRITTSQGTGYGFREGYPYYYFNLFEEIDSPGEWYLDRKTGMLYVYPPKDARGAIVQFPVLDKPFVSMTDVSHVAVLGLTFELNRTDAFVISGGRNVLLGGCTLRQLGGNGVVVRGGTGHLVMGCDILTVGAGGLRVAGGDPKTLTPGGHVVENCHVFDFSRVDRVYAPAVHLDGVGNRISHNLFHESPHHAMRVEGYEHTIEFNEVHSVVWESDDQAGIDIYGNAAYRGNVIRYNFWHHIGSGRNVAGQAGIRLDDFISGTLMYGNVFYRAADGRFGGIQIHGGKDNIADNNLFVDCRAAFSFSPWGEARWKRSLKERGGPTGTVWAGIDVSKPPHAERWPELLHLEENADRNFLARNVAVNCGRFALRERGVNEIYDAFLFGDEITFAGKDEFDFTLPPDSPIYDRLGFRPIPFDEIGLYASPLRASWPVEHRVSPNYHGAP